MPDLVGDGLSFFGSQKQSGMDQKRFDQYLGFMKKRTEAAQRLLSGYGEAQIANINQSEDERLSNSEQDLVSRGLTNSTIKPGIEALNERERQAALNNANEAIMKLKAGVYTGTSGDQGNAMGSFNGVPNSYGAFAGSGAAGGQMLGSFFNGGFGGGSGAGLGPGGMDAGFNGGGMVGGGTPMGGVVGSAGSAGIPGGVGAIAVPPPAQVSVANPVQNPAMRKLANYKVAV